MEPRGNYVVLSLSFNTAKCRGYYFMLTRNRNYTLIVDNTASGEVFYSKASSYPRIEFNWNLTYWPDRYIPLNMSSTGGMFVPLSAAKLAHAGPHLLWTLVISAFTIAFSSN